MAVFKKQLECKEENPEVLIVDHVFSLFLPALPTPLNLYSAHANRGFSLLVQLHPKASSPDHQRADVKIHEDILSIPRNKT